MSPARGKRADRAAARCTLMMEGLDALGRLIEDQQARPRGLSAPADRQLLLLAARRRGVGRRAARASP